MLVEWVAECAWNRWQNDRGIRTLYVFINRQRDKIKVLYWHRNGFCLWLKRLEEEKFHWPKRCETNTQTVTIREFEWLLEGIDLWRNKPHKTLNFACVS